MRSILILCLLCLVALAHAQSKLDTGSFLHFGIKDDFPSDNVYSVIQDKNGYLWFATDNGVVKYNGYALETFNTENGGLPTNDIFELYEDSRGRIWLKGFSYKFGYIKNGKYRSIAYKSFNRVTIPTYLSEVGNIFYFLEHRREYFYNLVFVNDNVLQTVYIPSNLTLPGDSSGIFVIVLAANLDVFIFTFNKNIFRFTQRSATFKKVGTFSEELANAFSHRNSVSPCNEIFLYKELHRKLLHFNLSNLELKTFDIANYGADSTEHIYSLNTHFYKGNYERTSALLTNSHMYTFLPDLTFVSRQKFSEIIPTTAQLAFRMKDRSGNYWLTTNGNGVWFKPATYSFYAGKKKNGLLDKAKYLGTIGGRNYWWLKTNSTLYEQEKDRLISEVKLNSVTNIEYIIRNKQTTYLAATNGLFVYDHEKQSLTNVTNKYEIANVYNKSIVEPGLQSRDFVLGNIRNGYTFDDVLMGFANDGIRTYKVVGDTLFVDIYVEDRFTAGFADTANRILYSYNSHRVLIHELATDKRKILDDHFLDLYGIKNIKRIAPDKWGNVYVLDDAQLFVLNRHTKHLTSINTDFSFAGSDFKIIGDNLYVAGRFGLAYATLTSNAEHLTSFHMIPNLGADQYNRVHALVVNENYITVQTDVDWRCYNIDSLKKHAELFENSEAYFSLILLKPLEHQIMSSDTFKVKQEENILQLDAINFYGKGEPKYSYRINDATKWEKSTSGEIFIAGLSPGKYHKIVCKVNDDCWQSKTYTFYLYRYPHWWQTTNWKTIFWITAVLLLLGLVLLSILITRNYVARKGEKKRALTELELRAIHSQINPHFIFNTLNSSLFFINKKRFDDAYDHVNKFSRLLRAYLKSSQDRFVILEEEITMLRNYIELQQTRFEEKFDYSIEVDNKLPINNIRIPSLLLQPLVENAINHGLFHKERGEKGELILKFQQGASSTELICIIEDNGVGRAAAKKINEETTSKESYGTKLTHQLLEIFKEYEALDISLEYTDKQAPQTGTIVTLTLKNIKYIV